MSLAILARQYAAIANEIGTIEKHIHAWHRSCEESRRLEQIPGVGPIVATALVAEVGDWTAFSSGRSLAAWIGLVPRQHSTGGKERLGRILHVMMSMRSDFLGHLQADKPLFKAREHVDVPPLGEEELREIVSRPAELLSARFESDGLVDVISRRAAEDVWTEPDGAQSSYPDPGHAHSAGARWYLRGHQTLMMVMMMLGRWRWAVVMMVVILRHLHVARSGLRQPRVIRF